MSIDSVGVVMMGFIDSTVEAEAAEGGKQK